MKKTIFVDGIYYNLDLRHLIDRRFFFHKTYENELFQPITNIINNKDIEFFFDIGLCWGIYSLRLSSQFKNLCIYSYDPIKKIFIDLIILLRSIILILIVLLLEMKKKLLN
jgi:hypothetical protein